MPPVGHSDVDIALDHESIAEYQNQRIERLSPEAEVEPPPPKA